MEVWGRGSPSTGLSGRPRTFPAPVHFPGGQAPAASLAASFDMEGPGDSSLGGTVALPWGDTSGVQSHPDTCQVESPALLNIFLICLPGLEPAMPVQGETDSPGMMPGSPQWGSSHHQLPEAMKHPLKGLVS